MQHVHSDGVICSKRPTLQVRWAAAFWTLCSLYSWFLGNPYSRLLQKSRWLVTKAFTRIFVHSKLRNFPILWILYKWKNAVLHMLFVTVHGKTYSNDFPFLSRIPFTTVCKTLHPFEQLGHPVARNTNLFERLGHPFAWNTNSFEWLGHPFTWNTNSFKRLGHLFTRNTNSFEWLDYFLFHVFTSVVRDHFLCFINIVAFFDCGILLYLCLKPYNVVAITTAGRNFQMINSRVVLPFWRHVCFTRKNWTLWLV